MRGSIKKRCGNWHISVYLGRDPGTGKPRYTTTTVRGTKKEAEAAKAKLIASVEEGTFVKPSRNTVAQWLERWLSSYVATHCNDRTLESYQSAVRQHLIPSMGGIRLSQLRPQHVQDYYARALSQGRIDKKGGLSPRTVLYHHRILSEALTNAVELELLGRNVAKAVKPPRVRRKEMKTMAAENIPIFLEAARETPYYLLFYTAIYTGLRLGELLGLRWCDVDLDKPILSVVQTLYKRGGRCEAVPTKTPGSRRRIPLTPSLVLLLHQYGIEQQAQGILVDWAISDSDFVFCHQGGMPFDPGVVSHTFAKVLKNAGLPHIRFHDLRHTHATLLLKADVHPKIVSERLGHASINITLDTYSHILPGMQEAAAKLLDEIIDLGVANGGEEGVV